MSAMQGAGIGGSIGGMLGSIMGEIWAIGDDYDAMAEIDKAIALIDNLKLPSIESQQLKLQFMEFVKLGPSAMEKVKVDPMFEGIQKEALSSFKRTADSMGIDARARAAQFEGEKRAAQTRNANAGAIKQNMRARGISGSGLDLASQLMNAQGEADTNASTGFAAAADSEARREQALDKSVALAGRMGDTDFSRQSAVANAKDSVDRYNNQGQNATNQANTQIANEEQVYNKNLIGEDYRRRAEKARMQQEGRLMKSDQYARQGDRKRRIASGIGEVAGTAIGAIFGG